MTRAEKLYENLRDIIFDTMHRSCPGDNMDGPDFKSAECKRLNGDCFKCWMAEYEVEK